MKKVRLSDFEIFCTLCAPTTVAQLQDFFASVKQHCHLPKRDYRKIVNDFENAIMYLAKLGTPMPIVLERLSPSNLGNFYSRHNTNAFPLDNAAKIYPLTMSHGQMIMFRLSVYLKELVVPEILQMALTFTIKRFPSFATDVKKGFYWHYLNSTQRRYGIEQETHTPCRPMSVSASGSPAFRLVYYNNRISVEFFHVLTDGNGGIVFLKTLVAEYLRLLGITTQTQDPGILDINTAPEKAETQNAFAVVDKTDKSSGLNGKVAVQHSGRLSKVRPCQIIHFKMNAAKLKAIATAQGGSVTAYMLAKMFAAGKVSTEKLDSDYVIQLPVNLRKFYPHPSLLNFSMYCSISEPITAIKDDNSLIPDLTAQIQTKAAKQPMDEICNATQRIISSLAPIPLCIKSFGVKMFYHFLADAVFSNILSSLGVIKMPPELAAHIDSMDCVLGNSSIHRTSCSLLTFGDTATFTISKNTLDPTFEERIYQLLKQDGLEIKVERSPVYGR